MAIHIIPVTEPEIHTETQDCICEPTFILDEGSGEMIWAHNIIDWDRLLDDIIQI